MKKVLLVSPFPYSKTGRGMDVLTESFEESGWETSHLNFPNVFYTVRKKGNFSTNVLQYTSKKALIPYIDSLMKWFPGFLFSLIVSYQRKKASFINFNDYDYVVLESGKPLFLIDKIPGTTKIIYRQSDSVRYILGKNKFYIELEDKVFKRAERILVVKGKFKKLIDEKFQLKSEVILNGYSIPQNINLVNPYDDHTKNAIYVGLSKLDIITLKTISNESPKLNIHIFGDCLKKTDLWKLKKFNNIFYYGFQNQEKYLSYIKYADVAIYPFKKTDGMKWAGFTSKHLNFMYYNLPIISYLTGEKSEFDGMGVHFAENAHDFALKVSKVIESKERGQANIDFHFFSHEERKKEYKEFINSLQ